MMKRALGALTGDLGVRGRDDLTQYDPPTTPDAPVDEWRAFSLTDIASLGDSDKELFKQTSSWSEKIEKTISAFLNETHGVRSHPSRRFRENIPKARDQNETFSLREKTPTSR